MHVAKVLEKMIPSIGGISQPSFEKIVQLAVSASMMLNIEISFQSNKQKEVQGHAKALSTPMEKYSFICPVDQETLLCTHAAESYLGENIRKRPSTDMATSLPPLFPRSTPKSPRPRKVKRKVLDS